jgi:UDP-N-acetylmuramate dehydrogenase
MPTIKNALLRDYAYYGTGGPCDVLYAPASAAELAANVREIKRLGLPVFVLGAGTNSLVMDEPFSGAFIVMRDLVGIEVRGTKLVVGAGVDNSEVARTALRHGLAGAAWMNRLPGQIGGTVRMNARCYGGEISEIATKVTVVTALGEIREYSDPLMFRGYKDTVFMDNGDLIVSAELLLESGDPAAIAAAMKYCETDRQSKKQFDFPSCGCVFKNDYDVSVPSGMLLSAAGAKGMKRGGAEVSPHHANFVYNKGATSRDILELTLAMRDLVYAEYGVWMSYEMELLGTVPADLAALVSVKKPQQLDLEKIQALRQRLSSRSPS